jgi:hypothetical protein
MQTTRRVRHDVADALLLMGFSLGTSVVVAVGIAVLARLQ